MQAVEGTADVERRGVLRERHLRVRMTPRAVERRERDDGGEREREAVHEQAAVLAIRAATRPASAAATQNTGRSVALNQIGLLVPSALRNGAARRQSSSARLRNEGLDLRPHDGRRQPGEQREHHVEGNDDGPVQEEVQAGPAERRDAAVRASARDEQRREGDEAGRGRRSPPTRP